MSIDKNEFYNFLNKIPTNLRGKYISILKNKKSSEEDILSELELLANETAEKILPKITYPDLPVAEKVDYIKKLITENQVIVVAGETGSGKSTQLPKICLDMGLGKRGLIGHTQPRRLAARSIASRVASEIGDQSVVSHKIRFNDQTSENTLIKVMTDGVLLSEIKNDRFLSQYEVIIIDEAHERSLNIDFLLGCIKKILPFRPDLKIIITSATIDHNKFTKYFANAKDISVVGRTYPVEIRYQDDIDFDEFSLQERILYAIDELGRGDVLVFLPTERDIHETLAYLNKQDLRFTEVLPLFSRLSNSDQNKIFNPEGSTRRVILATNVAETSLTVPRIKFVIDSGLVRISRYSYRTKVQRLPIEKISQASANQRAGRCGRLSAGVCMRLYSQEDFKSRKEFTDPEILRTNLASVILQMLFLKLGNVQDFPFIDPPDFKFVKDGIKLLFELQAIEKLNYNNPEITQDGLKMAVMPLDPKLAKIVIEAYRQGCLKEAISITSFLSIQDPRERPLNFQQKSDNAHAVDKDKNSDFVTILNLADRVTAETKSLTNREKKDYFRKNFISPVRFNEWNDIYRQVIETIHKFKWKLSDNKNIEILKQVQDDGSRIIVNYEKLHKSLISGLIGNIGYNCEQAEYLGARGLKFFIFPGSSQFKKKPKWLLSSEIVETTRLYARNIAKIEPEWIENLASHLVKKHYDEPVWSKKRKTVIANERVVLYGLEIVSKRSVQYSKVDETVAREIFIREALVNGEFETKAPFFNENLNLVREVEGLENKSRRRDILVDEETMFEHYDEVIPADVFDGVSFERWIKSLDKAIQQSFVYNLESLMQHDAKLVTQESYPDTFNLGNMHLPLEYVFNPLANDDGATLTLPLAFLNDISAGVIEWGVYGFLLEKITALLRALPKNIRKSCVPVPTYAQAIFESIDFKTDRLKPLKSVLAKHITRIAGYPVDETVWQDEELERHLVMSIKVVDEKGNILAIDKDLTKLKEQFKARVTKPKSQEKELVYNDWQFGDISKIKTIEEYGIKVEVYSCLELAKDGVKISYKATEKEAQTTMEEALTRLVKIRLASTLSQKIQKNDLASLSTAIRLDSAKDKLIERAIDLSFFRDLKLPCLATQSTPSFQRGLPYSQQEFDDFYNQGLEVFEGNKTKLETLVAEIYKAKAGLDKKLSVKKIPLNLIELYADVKKELDRLFSDNFLKSPLIYLERYKHYIQALENRLEKAKLNLQRDRGYKIEVEDLDKKLAKAIASKHIDNNSESVSRIEFLIKELWVSWYLQNVKTTESVSFKKIANYISQI